MLSSLSPLDGRYADTVAPLRSFFSEEALIRARLLVEVSYFVALSRERGIPEFPALSDKQSRAVWDILRSFDTREAEKVKQIEKTTKHDVKAVEYYLKEKISRIKGLKDSTEFIHFALTSEDTNNLAYGILIMEAVKTLILPTITSLVKDLTHISKSGNKIAMLSLTHGQPATPTTVGKEMMVFVERLSLQWDHLKAFSMMGKFGGAVGNFSAHLAAYPSVKWDGLSGFGAKFVKSLGFRYRLNHTTQINPHDDIAELSHILFRIDTILIDLSRDMWSYISRGVFRQKVIAGEVGSSTMPHKVNPIDFENAEGNFGLANALFSHFAEKLPISRLQRDLSDSTVQRSIGSAFGYHYLAVKSLQKGLGKLTLDRAVLKKELADHLEVHAEAIQTVLRKYKVQGAYEKLKALTRGEKMTKEKLQEFIRESSLPENEKKRLLTLL